MIGASVFGRILVAAGLIASMPVAGGTRRATVWKTRRTWQTGAQHSEARVAAAVAKRERRAAIVRRNVSRGAYGLNPYVGTKYLGNTGHNCAMRLAGEL